MGSKPRVRLPSPKHQSWEETPMWYLGIKSSGFLSTRKIRESPKDTSTLLKGQRTKYHLWLLRLGSDWKVEQSIVVWGESDVCGSGEIARGTTTSIHVLSHSPIPQIPSVLAGALSLVVSARARAIASFLGFPLAPPLELTPYWGVQPEALSVTEPNRQIVDRSRQRRISQRWLGTFADLSLGLVLVKAGFGVQLGTSCIHPDPGEATTSYRSLVASKRLSQASHRQCLTLACIRVLPKRLRSNTPSDQLQIILEKNPVSFTSSTSKERSRQAPNPANVNSASCGQPMHSNLHTVVRVQPQSASLMIDPSQEKGQ